MLPVEPALDVERRHAPRTRRGDRLAIRAVLYVAAREHARHRSAGRVGLREDVAVLVEVELAALRFAWRVAKHAKSNAIVLTSADQVIGVGAGQMNRVDSARVAVMRARANSLETRGTVCASDAFFPFRDGLDVVAEAGATAVIHPGGSLRDEEVVKAADERGMAMVVCGIRHFKH